MKKLLVLSLAFVLIISALLLVGCSKEPEKEPVVECTHSYEKTVTPPTCIEAGEEKFSCTKCDHFYTIKIDAFGHTNGTPVEENRTEATCTVDGKCDTVVYCTVCEAEVSRMTATISAKGHTRAEAVMQNYEKPDCVNDGHYDSVVYCTVCDAEVSRKIVTVAATGVHNVQNGVCTICGDKESTPGLEYSQNADGTYTVTGIGTCTETDIVIGISDNRYVTTIGEYAFHYCTSLTSIELPDSLTTIGYCAFDWCTSLTSIELPESLTTIGELAFYYCTSLTSIELPDSLTTIGDRAFYECTSLTSIELPDSLTAIGDRAFYKCTSLTSIVIPEGVTTIGYAAFCECTSLKSIELPDSLTTIGARAFCNCDSLTSIVIPEGVTAIGYEAFRYCTSLTIYCEIAEKQSGWDSDWNFSSRPVVWGYTG